MEEELKCGLCLGAELTVKHEKVVRIIWIEITNGLKLCGDCKKRPAKAVVTDKKAA